jgi:predicted PurR-regulated permease PerM
MSAAEQRSPVRQAVEIAVSLGLILIIVAWCLQILSPFASLLAWGAIIAISVYPLFLKLRARLGGSNKLAVIVFSVIGLGIVIVPSWMFADSMIDSVQHFHASAEAGQFEIKPPPESVKDWPLVGGRVYEGWAAASANTRQFLELHHEKVESLTRTVPIKPILSEIRPPNRMRLRRSRPNLSPPNKKNGPAVSASSIPNRWRSISHRPRNL